MRSAFGFVACVAAVVGAAPAFAQEIRATGCLMPGVESGCMILKASDGTLYNVTSASPKPDIAQRLAISVIAKKFDGATTCMQGTALTDIHWAYTKMRCD